MTAPTSDTAFLQLLDTQVNYIILFKRRSRILQLLNITMTSTVIFTCCVLLASCLQTLALPDAPVYLKRTLDALENALDFFDEERNHLNLDAIIGTRIVEGMLLT